jgi:hypothetical protein
MLNIDIDKLLESTLETTEENYSFTLSKIDIDQLLENTMDW